MKNVKDSKGRPVCDLEWQCEDESAFCISAAYADVMTHEAVPESELEWITDNYPELGDEWAFDAAIMRAEAMSEGDR